MLRDLAGQVAWPFAWQDAFHESNVVTGRNAYQPHDLIGSNLVRSVACRLGRCLAIACVGLLLATTVEDCNLIASEVDFPVVAPLHTIYVEAESVAKDVRGAYDVLAFEGSCKLRQGELNATADKVTLWIERRDTDGMKLPGKIICYLDGHANVAWNDDHRLQDNRWMGRLFSLHPVDYRVQREVKRNDIPKLDWNNGFGSAVQHAQYTQAPFNNQNGGQVLAPPLLGVPANQPPADSTSGQLPAPPTTSVPPVSGAIPWVPNGGTNNSELIPRSGLVIPDDGRQPYPAAGIPLDSSPAVPEFPAPSQVVMQVPVPGRNFGAKSIEFLPRGNRELNLSFTPDPNTGESIGMVRGGFKLVVHDVEIAQSSGGPVNYGTVTLEADNAVVWIRNNGTPGSLGGLVSTNDQPIEMYLDGNIVFYQGQRVIYADRMYYNVSSEYGMVLAAEVITPVPQYQGLLRLKADVLQQRDRQNFMAYGAAFTSSRLGVPRYWMQAGEVKLQDQRTEADMSALPSPDSTHPTHMRATANSNFVYLGGLPIAYWPTFSSNLSKPSFYLTSLKFKNDQIFGTQIYSDFDAYQLLGIDGFEGTSLRASADYLSERGPAGGFLFNYNRPTPIFGIPGVGVNDGWFIYDSGLDTLGSDRVLMQPEQEPLRGRYFAQSHLYVNPNLELIGQSGWISDRNFLEQYFEQDWDQRKDLSTELRLRHYSGNKMLDIWGAARVNDFFTETETVPRIDQYWLGQDLFGQRFTYSEHSSVGYVHQEFATTPTDPQDAAKFQLRPWESDSEGIRAITRHELSLPVDLGAWKFVPYLSGEAAYWGKDINQESVARFTGQGGLRTALPFWRTYENYDSRLFDIRGIAHKVTLESDLFYADSSADLDRLPLYDPIDDNSQEHFRRSVYLQHLWRNVATAIRRAGL